MGLVEDIKRAFTGLKDAGPAFVYEWVGQQFAVPFLTDLMGSWTVERLTPCVRAGQHVYPAIDADLRAQWRQKAQPYRRYAERIPRGVLFKWLMAARPDLAKAVMAQPGGWAWLIEELEVITADLFGRQRSAEPD